MAHAIALPSAPAAKRLLPAAAFALALSIAPLAAAPAAGPAAGPAAEAEAGKGGSSGDTDVKDLKERLRVLGEALRNAIEDASRSLGGGPDELARGKGGLAALAPRMRGRELRTVYGPHGPTLRSVRALLAYRLVLLGNDRLSAGRVYERDQRIIAEVVTVREKALVARYMIDKKTGIWIPEG